MAACLQLTSIPAQSNSEARTGSAVAVRLHLGRSSQVLRGPNDPRDETLCVKDFLYKP